MITGYDFENGTAKEKVYSQWKKGGSYSTDDHLETRSNTVESCMCHKDCGCGNHADNIIQSKGGIKKDEKKE